MDILSQYTSGTVTLVATTFLLAHTVFPQSDDANMLEQVFCFAVRDALLDELEGVSRPVRTQLDSVIARLGPDTPESVTNAFRRLTPDSFAKTYHAIRMQADASRVDLAEFADALRLAKAIMTAVAHRRESS